MQDIMDAVRRFVRDEVMPLEPAFLAGSMSAVASDTARLRDEVRARGWWAPQVPRALGGMGLSIPDYARMSEVLGVSPLGHYVFGGQAPDAGNIEILHEFATPAQRALWLDPLASGRIRSCFAMTEPEHAGSNPTRLSTTAVRDGDQWVLNGHKWFTTAAHGAAFAIVMAVTAPDAPAHARASMIIVPTDTRGFVLVRNIPVMGEQGNGWSSHSEVRLEDCRVPVDHLLGQEGAGFRIAQQRLGPGRIHHCMRWVGIAERALDLMCRRAVARDLGDGPLASKQTIQSWIAESRAEIDAARLMVLHAAEALERHGARGARVEISMIKYFVADVMLRVVDRALQTHGALGMTDDTVLAWFYRHERASRIYDGPDEVHKQVVARAVLSRYTEGEPP